MDNFKDLVLIKNNQTITTSLRLAKVFNKEHKNVIRSIKNLNSSEEFNRLNFELVNYFDAKGEIRKMYNITRDGFTILAMGFTGKKAMKFKEAYIKAFNDMAELLNQTSLQGELLNIKRSLRKIDNHFQYELFQLPRKEINQYKSKKSNVNLKLDIETKNKFKSKCSSMNYSMRGFLRHIIDEVVKEEK